MSYHFIKKFINKSVVNAYLDKSTLYTEFQSKIGNIVDPTIKRRKDICFTRKDCQILDNIVFSLESERVLDQHLQYRELYKLGTYTENDKGFYSEHTDTQGGMTHRKISMLICLSSSDDYEGGMFYLKPVNEEVIKFKFNVGDAILFDSNLLHAVDPVTKGTRKVIISFLFNGDVLHHCGRLKNFSVETCKPFSTRLENIISYTLLDGGREIDTILENSKIAKKYYPDYMLYIYYDKESIGQNILQLTLDTLSNESNIKLVGVDNTNNRNLWKFFPAIISNGIVLVRDSKQLLEENIDSFLAGDVNLIIEGSELQEADQLSLTCRYGAYGVNKSIRTYTDALCSNDIITDKKFI